MLSLTVLKGVSDGKFHVKDSYVNCCLLAVCWCNNHDVLSLDINNK